MLAQRFPDLAIWDDVTTFRADNPETSPIFADLRSVADSLVIAGGFPCQDISCAGRGAGIGGERSGLWREYARIICEIRPRFVFVENSPMLANRGLGDVLRDLAAMGYDAAWGVLSAEALGARHKRERIWISALRTSDTDGVWELQQSGAAVHPAPDYAPQAPCRPRQRNWQWPISADGVPRFRVGRCLVTVIEGNEVHFVQCYGVQVRLAEEAK